MNRSDEEWEKAKNHTLEMKEAGKMIGPCGIFYVLGCNEYLDRYEKGERTEELYQSMIGLH